MANKKKTKIYYFTVEGETEEWYLKWLQSEINRSPAACHRVVIKTYKLNPVKLTKKISIITKTDITDLYDYESNDLEHMTRFSNRLDSLKQASTLGKQIKFRLGYSNLTFELWMVLHKTDCKSSLNHRTQYLELINRAFNENFESLNQYKHESNFKKILGKISLQNVKEAIRRSNEIMSRNQEIGYTLQRYKGYEYYRDNPSLSICKSINRILQDVHL